MTDVGPEALETDLINKATRRELLSTVSGFVLAAGGLFLPGCLDEADARNGALDGAKGGRRGKNRRGRDKRKQRDDKKNERRDEAPPPGRGAFEFRKTAVGVSVPAADYTVSFFYRQKTGLDDYGPWVQANPVPLNGRSTRYAPDRYRIGALVSAPATMGPGQFFVDLRNMSFGFPQGAVYVGTGLDPVRNNLGQELVKERSFATTGPGSDAGSVQRLYSIREDLYGSLWLYRSNDSDDFIEFYLQVGS